MSGAPLVKTGLTTTSYTIAANEALTTAGAPYTWIVTAYDAANASAVSSTWSFFVDTTPPDAFAITSPAPTAWTNTSNARLLWNPATDTGSGIGVYHVYVDGVLCSSPAADITGAGLYRATCTPGEGTHFWSVAAEDAVGNVTWCSECANGTGGREFRIDDTGPSNPEITGGTFQIASSNEPDYYGNPSDDMVDTGLTITADQPLSISASGDWCTLGCGSSIGCYSVAGSSSSSAVVPASNCTPFSLIARIGGTFYCVGTGTDISPTTSGKLYLGINSEYSGCSTPTVTATVTGGRSFDLIEPAEGAVLSNRSPLFSWQAATDAASGGLNYSLWVEQTNSTNTNIQSLTTVQTSSALPSVLNDGTYEWYVRASDAAKNPTESVVRHFTIDTARPDEFRLSLNSVECTSVPTPSLCWSSAKDASAIASHQLYIDGALAVTTTTTCSTPTVALSQGLHSWYVVQTDRAGNWRQSSDTRQLWVDYTPPSAPALTAPAEGASLVDPPVFTWAAATDNVAIKSYEVYVDGTLAATLDASTLTYLSKTDLSVGNHTWYVRALDRCGQAGAAAARSFTIVACTPDGAQHPCPGHNLGPCKPGTRTCTATGTWSSCSDAVAPTTESCNDVDDNCDGVVDNSVDYIGDNQCGGVCIVTPPYIWSPCDGPDADQCQEGHLACDGLNRTVCVETTPNNVEICNGRDDDCNGAVDDGCVQGTGGAPSTGGTAGTGGVPIGTGAGATGATPTGGQGSYVSGGTSTLGGTTSTAANGGAVANIGGAVTNTGGAFANVGGMVSNVGGSGAGAGTSGLGSGGTGIVGSSGASGTVLGQGGAGGQTNLAIAGGSQAVAASGGTNANGTAGSVVSAGRSSGTQNGTLINSDAGSDEGSGSDSGCGCRVVAPKRPYGNFALLLSAALLLLGRRRAHRAHRKAPNK